MSQSGSDGFAPIQSDDDDVPLGVLEPTQPPMLPAAQRVAAAALPPPPPLSPLPPSSDDDVPLAARAAALVPAAATKPSKRPRAAATTSSKRVRGMQQASLTTFVTNRPSVSTVATTAVSQSGDEALPPPPRDELVRDLHRFDEFAFADSQRSASSARSVALRSLPPVVSPADSPPPLLELSFLPPVPPPSPSPVAVNAPVTSSSSTAAAAVLYAVDDGDATLPLGDSFCSEPLPIAQLIDALAPFAEPFDFDMSDDTTATSADVDVPLFVSAAPAAVDDWQIELDDDTLLCERERALHDVQDRLAAAEPLGVYAAFGQVVQAWR